MTVTFVSSKFTRSMKQCPKAYLDWARGALGGASLCIVHGEAKSASTNNLMDMGSDLTRNNNWVGTLLNLELVNDVLIMALRRFTRLLLQPNRMKADAGEAKVAANAAVRT